MDAASWDKAKDLIADALALPEAQRDAYLQSRCADPVMLAEVRDILRDYADNASFLEHPPHVSGLDPFGQEDEELDPGSQIGPYVVVDRLGRGGMGQVFLGSDRRLRRKVALKRLLPSPLGAADERARILREARAAAQINHPNVATIHDVIEHEAHVFIVMEYVDGESLAERLRRGRMRAPEVVSIGLQIASALAAAHAMRIVHRDLKPGNIQLTRDGVAKVLDFGIAKALIASGSTSSTTSKGIIEVRGVQPGTPEYMSPEQMLGRSVDHRSDIFSLGIVLFEMATGSRPYDDGNAVDRFAALQSPAPRADEIDRDIPEQLADVIAKALMPDVNDRFQSAADVVAALEGVQRGLEPGVAGTSSLWASRTLASRLVRVLVAVAAVVVALGLLGLISTAAFNVTLQRPVPFASEPVLDYVRWGFRSNIALLVFALAAAMLAAALSFVAQLAGFINPLNRLFAAARATRRLIASTLHLNDPTILAQGLALIGTIGVVGLLWRYQRLIAAFMQKITVASPEQLLPLAPENAGERAPYGIIVNILTLICGAGFFRVMQLRARQRSRGGAGAAMIAGVVLAVLVLMQQVPYRIVWQNRFERIEFAGNRCYVIGQHEPEWLIYCPDGDAPRNRIIRQDDPSIRRTGIIESIFTRPAGNESAASPH